MNIKDYIFEIGDIVITTEGEKGAIINICKCDRCVERGFYEPTWIMEGDSNEKYITIGDAICGFNRFYQIGKYRFNDFDKSEVLQNMAYYEKELKQLRKQWKLIEELENEQ
jgi:hypothetical protein